MPNWLWNMLHESILVLAMLRPPVSNALFTVVEEGKEAYNLYGDQYNKTHFIRNGLILMLVVSWKQYQSAITIKQIL